MEIRFAKGQDVPGIIKLLKQVGSVYHAGRPDLFRGNAQKYGPSQVLEMLGKSDDPIFVAVEEETVLGYGFCTLETYHQNSVMKDRITLHVSDLWAPDPVGVALYEKILEYAKYRGCYDVTMDVWCCNEETVKFCEALGMKPQKIAMAAVL